MSRQNPRRRTPVYTLSLRRFKGEGLTREHGEPARKKTETRTKAEAGKKCMSGRRVEERVKSNEATKGTRGSQRPSKGRAQGRGHGRHTASTTPHRDTGEGSTRGTREERHHAPRHARHRHHTHRTYPTSPGSPPSGRAVGGGTAPDLRRPSQWWKAPPPGDALQPLPQRAMPARKGARCGAGAGSPRPHRPHPGHTGRGTLAARSRGHAGQGDAVGPPRPHTRAHSTWVADPNSPPNGRAVGGGTAPDLRRPSPWWKAPPLGDALPPPPQRATPARKGARCGAGAGPPRPHRPRPGHLGHGTLAARSRGRAARGGTAPNTRRPSQCWKAPPPGAPIRHPHKEHRTNAPTHQPRDIRTPPPALRHSDTTMAEPAAPRKTRPRSRTLDEAHEVIRALGLRDGEGDPPQGDAGTDSALEAVPEPPTGGAPAEPAPPAGSVPALCPAWKRGHCTGEVWFPKQHPQPGPDDGALPEVKPAAACAALRYGVAQGWILDETARGSVNIHEAVDRVTHAGQAAVALRTRGRHGGPAEGIIVEPSGMVLVLAADMVRGVLHASRVRRACPQWTIQVYTPPRAWPFSTWAVLAVMWHLAPEDAPTGTAEDIFGTSTPGRPTRITPGAGPGAASQWHPRQRGSASRQPSNGTPTRRHATSCRRARSRPPRQTPSGDGTQGWRNRCRAPGPSRCGICPWAPWPTPPRPSRGLSRSRSSPAWP